MTISPDGSHAYGARIKRGQRETGPGGSSPGEGTCLSSGWRKSVARGDRSGLGRDVIVEAELHDIDLTVEVQVVNEPAARQNGVEVDVSIAEVHEVVFDLPGPVTHPIFEAHADHPAASRVVVVVEDNTTVADGRRRHSRTVVPESEAEVRIGKRTATLDIEQPVASLAKRHAEPRGYGRDPATAVAAPEQKIVRSRRREEAASLVVVITGDPAYLALDAPHPLADLVIVANLAAADEPAVVVSEPVVDEGKTRESSECRVESVVVISVEPGPADVGANVDAIPVVHDGRCRRWRLQGHVGGLRGTPQNHSGKRGHSKQQLSH